MSRAGAFRVKSMAVLRLAIPPAMIADTLSATRKLGSTNAETRINACDGALRVCGVEEQAPAGRSPLSLESATPCESNGAHGDGNRGISG